MTVLDTIKDIFGERENQCVINVRLNRIISHITSILHPGVTITEIRNAYLSFCCHHLVNSITSRCCIFHIVLNLPVKIFVNKKSSGFCQPYPHQIQMKAYITKRGLLLQKLRRPKYLYFVLP